LTTIFDESEAGYAKAHYYATLARMSLSELLYHVLTLDGSPVQIASTAKMHKAPAVFGSGELLRRWSNAPFVDHFCRRVPESSVCWKPHGPKTDSIGVPDGI
jgi:hypothetical protein